MFFITLIAVFVPYTMSDAITAMQPGGFTFAMMGPHVASAIQTGFLSQTEGEFLAWFIAAFFFMMCWTVDRPRWRYYFIALIVYDLFSWFTIYAVGLTIAYFYFGLGKFVLDEGTIWFERQVQRTIPVTQVQPDPALLAEIARRKAEFAKQTDYVKGLNAKNKMQAQLYPNAKAVANNGNEYELPPYSQFGTVSGRSAVPGNITEYTAGYSPEVFRHEKRGKPIRGIRWFGKTPNGRPLSIGWGITKEPGKGGWDDIGQITASHVPTPDNAAGAYMFDESMIGSEEFDRHAEPGGFAAEVDMWGQIVYHPVEKVYRGEKAKIYKVLFTYEEWVKGERKKYKR